METGDTRTPISGVYSPLTVTTTGISVAGRESVNLVPPAAPAPAQSGRGLTVALALAALALVGGIVAYVMMAVQTR